LAEKFASRADQYDRSAAFPAADFEDIFAAGLHGPCVPRRFGGFGFGPKNDLFTLWMMTKELAAADMSLARCWEGHVNSQLLIAALGSVEQQERWFEGVVRRGDKWVSWSGEPQARAPGQPARYGTTTREVDGGFVVDGTKVFATSAGHAQWAILLVNTEGPGGARHCENSPEALLLLACDLSDKSVTYDDSWWDPIGMRGTVSYLVRFDRTFIPRDNLIGRPGQYLLEHWQTRFTPHYAATFLGAAEAAYRYALDYLQRQGKGHDPYVQHRVAEMSMNVETAHLWLEHVAQLWETSRDTEARDAGNRARFLVERLAVQTVDHCIRACGARCLNRPSALERIYRDLSFYVRHDNADHVLAAIGQQALGLPHDVSFFNRQAATPQDAPQCDNSREKQQ
jgi:alkylation response protein AidB-like acyl-CoA dehydrogenase